VSADPRIEELARDVSVLWPHLGVAKRMEWVDRMRPHFGNDFVATVRALSTPRD
jgi:hypothetical protein